MCLRNISLVTGYGAVLVDDIPWPGKKSHREEMAKMRPLEELQSGAGDSRVHKELG